MPMLKTDLGRAYQLTVAASGHVFVNRAGSALEPGALPVFSTDTHEEALALVVRHCRRANDGSGLYRLTNWINGRDVNDALDEVSDLFRADYNRDPPLLPGALSAASETPAAPRWRSPRHGGDEVEVAGVRVALFYQAASAAAPEGGYAADIRIAEGLPIRGPAVAGGVAARAAAVDLAVRALEAERARYARAIAGLLLVREPEPEPEPMRTGRRRAKITRKTLPAPGGRPS